MTDSSFLCRMDSLAFALKAAVKVAGKDELAFVRLHRLNEDTLSVSALGNDVSFRAKLKVDFIHWNDDRDDRVEISKHAANSLAGYQVKTPEGRREDPRRGRHRTLPNRRRPRRAPTQRPDPPRRPREDLLRRRKRTGRTVLDNSRGHQHHRRRGQGAPPSNCHAQPFRTGRVRLPLVRPR